jgi:predicted O-linked N-acetylglucosamine transferase (SPINDLY family)
MTGPTSVSRAGESILHAAGLVELATETPEAFVAAATELARELDGLAELRRSMRRRLLASPLMDHRGFARNLEAAYREMWLAWCDGPAPELSADARNSRIQGVADC